MAYATEHCTKIPHASKAVAEGQILLLQRAGKARPNLHAYHCDICGQWHIGRDSTHVYNPPSRADWARPDRRC